MELARGIEPPTGGLQNHCSAIELRQPCCFLAHLAVRVKQGGCSYPWRRRFFQQVDDRRRGGLSVRTPSFYVLVDGKKVIGKLFYYGLNELGNSTCYLLADYCNLHSVPCTRGHPMLRSVHQ